MGEEAAGNKIENPGNVNATGAITDSNPIQEL
jgi:hypothetical protein